MGKKYYKGFNPDMTCRGFHYEEGKEYETDKAELCKCGFHACEAPLDVFGYYPPVNDNIELNRFHEVELEEISDEKSDDTKVVAKKIKVGAELNLFGLAKAHVEWVKSNVDKKNMKTNTGNWSAATNTGENSIAVAWGIGSRAMASMGSYIVIADWRLDKKDNIWKFHRAKMHMVDGKIIKPNVFYKLENGKFVEAESQENQKEN